MKKEKTAKSILFCYGTRPEFIKIAPVASALKKYPTLKTLVMCSGQHKELLSGMGHVFKIVSQFDLQAKKKIGSSDNLSLLVGNLIHLFSEQLTKLKPSAVVIQGIWEGHTCFPGNGGGLAAFIRI